MRGDLSRRSNEIIDDPDDLRQRRACLFPVILGSTWARLLIKEEDDNRRLKIFIYTLENLSYVKRKTVS